jgi:hypothetical protein
MKNKLFIAVMILLSVNVSFAQKVLDDSYSFKYKRLPSNPIDKSIKTYKGVVELAYEEEDKQKLADYNNQVNANNAQYQKDKQAADAQYAADKKAYQEKSVGSKFVSKVVLEESGPQKENVGKEHVEKPYIRKTMDKNLLASTYINLNGYSKATNANLTITFVAHGIEWMEPTITEGSQTPVSGANAGKPQKTYFGSIKYRSPVSIKVEAADGTVILNEVVEATNEYKSYETTTYLNRYEAEDKSNPTTVMPQFEQKMIEQNMKLANDVLNSKCATSIVDRKTIVYNIETKKVDYSDYQSAYTQAIEAYTFLSENQTESLPKLKAAVDIWAKALKESNITDKKARINKDITIITIFNLAEGYMWLNDFANAKLMLTKTTTLDLSRKEKAKVEDLKSLIEDQKLRYEANQ